MLLMPAAATCRATPYAARLLSLRVTIKMTLRRRRLRCYAVAQLCARVRCEVDTRGAPARKSVCAHVVRASRYARAAEAEMPSDDASCHAVGCRLRRHAAAAAYATICRYDAAARY